MDIYREIILDHYKNPRNYGHLANSDKKAEGANASCGDKIRMEVQLSVISSLPAQAGQSTVKDIRFNGTGCAISQATASMLTEKVIGLKVDEILKLETKDILEMLGTDLTPSRVKCATLPLEVLHSALI
ncbi:iron-sulfur cluster assembly scaffold protein [Patescibacteria group bacterium]